MKVKMTRTTIDLPSELFIQAKMMALLTGKPMAHLIRIALTEKIKELKETASTQTLKTSF